LLSAAQLQELDASGRNCLLKRLDGFAGSGHSVDWYEVAVSQLPVPGDGRTAADGRRPLRWRLSSTAHFSLIYDGCGGSAMWRGPGWVGSGPASRWARRSLVHMRWCLLRPSHAVWRHCHYHHDNDTSRTL